MKWLSLLAFTLVSHSLFAQNKGELPFIEHLVNRGDFREAIHLIHIDSTQRQGQKDSMYYYRGWAHYSLKNLEPSTEAFLNVGKASAFYLKSRFFAGYNQIFLKNYEDAGKILGTVDLQDVNSRAIVNLELSGIDLLKGDMPGAKERIQQLNPSPAIVNQQIAALGQINKEMVAHRQKSPFLAGMMSSIIPGSGKIYAGKTGEGIASFIATTGFGLITWENYRKLGIDHAKTLFFGAVFATNYISNIYGSVISVKIIENTYQDAIHNQILFQLHIPLRNFFE